MRRTVHGSSTYAASCPVNSVSSAARPSESGPPTGWVTGGTPGRALSRTPKVGHRGGCSAGRSNRSTGKFDSRPPSTQVAPLIRTGRKNSGMAADARTARATGKASGSTP